MKDKTVPVFYAAALLSALVLTIAYRADLFSGSIPGRRGTAVVIFKTINYTTSPFWGSVRDGIESAGKDFSIDVSIRGPENEADIDDQIRIVQQAIEEKHDAIVLAAADYNLLVPVAREIKKRGIRLICIDSFINSRDPDVMIGTDNYEGGRKCGSALMRFVDRGDKVAIMSYVKGSSTAIDREAGVRDFLNGKAELLTATYSNSDAVLAYNQAAELIEKTDGLRGIIALNEPTARGGARALLDSGRADSIYFVGFDNTFQVLKYVERGIIRATIVQRPFNMGYLGISIARDLMNGKTVPRFIDTGSLDITRDNMFLPENQKLLFPVSSGEAQ